MKNRRFVTLVAIVVVTALSRVVPHPWNATPLAAIALFAGAYFSDKRAAFLVPIAAMLMSDVVLGFYATLPFTYLCFGLTVLLGRFLHDNKTVARVGGAALGSSVMFFLVTNLVCWVTMPEYSKDASGLVQCYAMALPFFRGTLIGDLVFTGLFFGGFALSEKAFPALRESRQPA